MRKRIWREVYFKLRPAKTSMGGVGGGGAFEESCDQLHETCIFM